MKETLEHIPLAFQWKWIIAPAVILLIAIGLILFIPSPPPKDAVPIATSPETGARTSSSTVILSTEEAHTIALMQCAATYSCTETDCLEKVLTHIDSATTRIYAILKTPAPREFREHLRAAIARGVSVQLILDAALNPKFYLEGAQIHTKNISNFVATNFVLVDNTSIIVGEDPENYAVPPDTINVICKENERIAFEKLFLRLWENETKSFISETTEEEILSDEKISLNQTPNTTCEESSCPPDTFTCEGTTKLWQNYFCASGGCAYALLPLYFSSDCGYSNPGFGPQGEPLIIITETEFDEQNIETEFIEFTSLQSLELSGFTLMRNGVSIITFPTPYILDGAARVYTGNGTNTTTSIFLNSSTPLWSNPNTTAALVNPVGIIVAQQTFGG